MDLMMETIEIDCQLTGFFVVDHKSLFWKYKTIVDIMNIIL